VFKGLAAGAVTALVFAAAFGWLLLWATGARSQEPVVDTATVGDLEMLVAPVLRELNAVRRDVIKKVKERSATRVPLAAAAAFVFWLVAQLTADDPPGFSGLLIWLLIGAVAGETWAAHKLEKDYRRLYKDRVLPRLAARFGDLTYRQASHQDIQRLGAHRVFSDFDQVRAEDEITGTYRGLPISIVEARLERRSGDNHQMIFDGLLIQLTLPRGLTGTTAVISDEGMLGNFKASWRGGALQPVRLEDLRFEKRYEVYGTDQVEARALLTPAFMERFMALAGRSGFALPGALAEGNRMVVALPKSLHQRDLFEPPVYWKPAGGRAMLALNDDISAVLSMADTVIDLDFWARGTAGVTPPV
jgi:hypothetical protein